MKSAIDLSRFRLNDVRADLVFLARTAETAERYDDMVQFVEMLARSVGAEDLADEEHRLLAAACTRAIESRRDAARALPAGEQGNASLLTEYEKQLKAELVGICEYILDLLENTGVPALPTRGHAAVVVCLTLMGDCYRRLAEIITDQGYAEKADETYLRAMNIAKSSLHSHDPIRLGLLLNWAATHVEIFKDHKKAVEIAKRDFDDAISKLDQLDEASYKAATLILERLREYIGT